MGDGAALVWANALGRGAPFFVPTEILIEAMTAATGQSWDAIESHSSSDARKFSYASGGPEDTVPVRPSYRFPVFQGADPALLITADPEGRRGFSRACPPRNLGECTTVGAP
jgi:hypothetical protein